MKKFVFIKNGNLEIVMDVYFSLPQGPFGFQRQLNLQFLIHAQAARQMIIGSP